MSRRSTRSCHRWSRTSTARSRCTCTAVWRRARRAHRSRISTCLCRHPGRPVERSGCGCRQGPVVALSPPCPRDRHRGTQPWPGCSAMTSTASADAASSSITASRYTATISVSSCRVLSAISDDRVGVQPQHGRGHRRRPRHRLDTANDSGDVKQVCRTVARKVMLAAASLASVINSEWTTDRHRAAAAIAEHYPEWADQAAVALEWASAPTDDPSKVRKFLDGFGKWVAQELHDRAAPR